MDGDDHVVELRERPMRAGRQTRIGASGFRYINPAQCSVVEEIEARFGTGEDGYRAISARCKERSTAPARKLVRE